MGVITNIISSIYDAQGDLSADAITSLSGLMSRQQTTPMNYSVLYMGGTLTLYEAGAHEVINIDEHPNTPITDSVIGRPVKWSGLVNLYGKLLNGVSEVRLQFQHPTGIHQIVGHIAYDPLDEHNLLFTPISSTLPANTLPAVTAIIDPDNVDVDSMLLNPAVGTRYLILAPIGNANSTPAVAWTGATGTNLLANENDIIEWNGTYWHVSFDSRQEPNIQYVTNLNTTVQYCWTGESWVKSYEGIYTSGEWSLVL
jgi:hypothetical protein